MAAQLYGGDLGRPPSLRDQSFGVGPMSLGMTSLYGGHTSQPPSAAEKAVQASVPLSQGAKKIPGSVATWVAIIAVLIVIRILYERAG